MNSKEGKSREQFSSTFGILAAAVGSAVGLGNIWRFPYITGQYGGAAFLIIYLLMVVVIGLPMMVSEFIIGREGRTDAINSFKKIAPEKKWYLSGVLGVAAAFFILSFYGVVAGWTLAYILKAATNSFAGQSSEAITGMFTGFISHPIKPIVSQVLVMGLTAFVVSTGVQKGIEKAAKVLIPLLFAIIILLDIQAFMLPGGRAGFEFLFKPDFSKLTQEGILAALGHAFFSLSLGMGIMITYGSYIPDNQNLPKMAVNISIADTLIAILSGIAIFPAVFAFNIEPTSGAGLVFMTLPNVFSQMPGGYIFGLLFFFLLFVAALTSTISLLEAVVAYVVDNFKIERKRATLIVAVLITLIGTVSSLSQGPLDGIKIFGKVIFDFVDDTTANYFLPISAFIGALFVGWGMNRDTVISQVTNRGDIQGNFVKLYMFLIKFIVPIGILIVFLFQIGLLK